MYHLFNVSPFIPSFVLQFGAKVKRIITKIQRASENSQNSYCCQFQFTRKLRMLYTSIRFYST